MNPGSPVSIDSVAELVPRFKTFLVDQFGVLHNGFDPYPGAARALRTLKSAGGRIIIISNSGKRASVNKTRMHSLGFDDDCFDELVTSGEVAWHLLQHHFIGNRFAAGAQCFFLSNNDDRSAVEGLDLNEVDNVNDAELILLSGQHLDGHGLTSVCQLLEAAVRRNIPCICTNPDKVAYAAGGKVFSSGAVAQWYESHGGEVIWLGKPYAEIYEHIFSTQAIDDLRSVVCVGDSVEHDIKGGAQLGLSTLLVRTGINDHLNDNDLRSLYLEHDVVPDFVIPGISCGSAN